VRIEVCIDMDVYDIALLLQLARTSKTTVDSLIKKAVVEYIERNITTQQGGS